MVRFVSNIFCFLFSLIIIEFNLYERDYNELLMYKNYIEYDISNGNLEFCENDKYITKIKIEEEITYEIIMKRKSLFKINKLKIIKYHGIVN